jgi:hypothetical protein
MLSLRFVSLTAVSLLAASSMAQAAPGMYHHNVSAQQFRAQQSSTTIPPRTASYAASELWTSCLQGPPVCTAAGYPNLHYQQEIGNGR